MLTQIEIPNGAKIVSASCGRLSTVLTDNKGSLYSFGNATNGRLGNGSRRKVLDPTPVELEEGQAIMSASGMDHTIVLSSS
jgi:alpha-tubulin suppressor-like RCC1 family protein